MSREKIVAGNWKMNNDSNQTKALIGELKKLNQLEISVMIAPAYTNLSMAQDLLLDSKIEVVAQNMHFSDSGAFTYTKSSSYRNITRNNSSVRPNSIG